MKAILTFICSLSLAIAFAQPQLNKREKIDSAKTIFISQRLLLTTAQSQKFWPAYKAYLERRKEYRDSIRKIRDEQASVNATDEQLKAGLKEILKIRKDELDLEEKFQNDLLSMLSVRQVVALKNAEREFMMLLRKKLHPRGGKLDKDRTK